MFLARKRLQEIKEKDREYKEKIKGIYGYCILFTYFIYIISIKYSNLF